jgi:glycosyltransferase involved in cell wall biosynthesis
VEYKSPYTWPASVPFRLFCQDANARIFIIENLHHNFLWLKEVANNIRETDYFFVICGWYFDAGFAQEAVKMFEALGLKKGQFFIMFNSEKEKDNFRSSGFSGEVINQNAWLKEGNFSLPESNTPKKFDATYIGRRSEFKRHMLAQEIPRLAIIAGDNHGNSISPIPTHAWTNTHKFSREEVVGVLHSSRVGIILSEKEGACFSSSEYLLCGLPVVSTKCLGGRDVWYDEYNSIVVDPDPHKIARAVSDLIDASPDPKKIRQMHIDKAEVFRKRFEKELQRVFDTHGFKHQSATTYFRKNFTPKMRAGMWLDDIISLFSGT